MVTTMIESNFFSIITAVISIAVAWGIIRTEVKYLKEKNIKLEKVVDSNRIAIERRNEEMISIHKRLDKIDDLKLEARLAEIKTELQHIRDLLEGGVTNYGKRNK